MAERDTRFPADSKLAIIGVSVVMSINAATGCDTQVLLVGMASISGLGGFTLGIANGVTGTEKTKRSE